MDGRSGRRKGGMHPGRKPTRGGIAPPRPWRNPAAACVSGAVCILRITASFSERNNSGSTSAGAPSEPSSSPTTSAVQKMDKILAHTREISSLVASCKKTPWRRRRLRVPPLLSGDRPWKFEGQDSSELSFDPGMIIRVDGKVHEEWWKGTSEGEVGLFPANHSTPVRTAKEGELVLVLYDFMGKRDTDLGSLARARRSRCWWSRRRAGGWVRSSPERQACSLRTT